MANLDPGSRAIAVTFVQDLVGESSVVAFTFEKSTGKALIQLDSTAVRSPPCLCLSLVYIFSFLFFQAVTRVCSNSQAIAAHDGLVGVQGTFCVHVFALS